jgi:DNA-binding transcriptional regulator PaaX
MNLAPVIGSRIHGWLAPLVDAATLSAIERAQVSERATLDGLTLEDRILDRLAVRSMTVHGLALELGFTEKVVKNAICRLRKLGKVDGEYGPVLRKKVCKIYWLVDA